MSKTIEQTVEFKNVTPSELYDVYLDSESHGAIIGGAASIRAAVGGEFQAFGGGLRGRILALVPSRQIVQSWRGQPWTEEDLDSTLILTFSATRAGARIHMVHANIPDHACELVNEEAWQEKYWKPWKRYFSKSSTA